MGAEIRRIGSLTIASAYTKPKLDELNRNRSRYDAACRLAAILYDPLNKTSEWAAACAEAKRLSKTVPLTIAKRKLTKDGRITYGDDE